METAHQACQASMCAECKLSGHHSHGPALQVRQNGVLLGRRGLSLPANASGFDAHRDSITRAPLALQHNLQPLAQAHRAVLACCQAGGASRARPFLAVSSRF
jgi:hypothetical protein